MLPMQRSNTALFQNIISLYISVVHYLFMISVNCVICSDNCFLSIFIPELHRPTIKPISTYIYENYLVRKCHVINVIMRTFIMK